MCLRCAVSRGLAGRAWEGLSEVGPPPTDEEDVEDQAARVLSRESDMTLGVAYCQTGRHDRQAVAVLQKLVPFLHNCNCLPIVASSLVTVHADAKFLGTHASFRLTVPAKVPPGACCTSLSCLPCWTVATAWNDENVPTWALRRLPQASVARLSRLLASEDAGAVSPLPFGGCCWDARNPSPRARGGVVEGRPPTD